MLNNDEEIVIALIGNPNSGKTSIFNHLTGTHQHVGNYPGVTVEKKEGVYTYKGKKFRVLDLPGTYSLTAFSMEEVVTRKALVEENISVVVDIVDSTNLDRNLYLAIQVIELGLNPVIALNFADEARFIGQVIDLKILSKLINSKCVETIGHRGKGTDDLKEIIYQAYQENNEPISIKFSQEIERAISKIVPYLTDKVCEPFPKRYVATKLLEKDENILITIIKRIDEKEKLVETIKKEKKVLEFAMGDDASILIGDQRHGLAIGLVKEATLSPPRYNKISLSDNVDSILTHRILGLPFFFILMYVLFWITFTIGEKPMEWIGQFFNWLAVVVNNLLPFASESPLRSLIVDGVIHGVGGVIVFLPNILLLFLGIAALEDTGYMARAAFIMDKVMHKIGLHGKSFIPMLVGFGCTVPAIMATRTLDSMRDRLTTILVLPLISCGARLTIYLLLIPAFFPANMHAFMLWIIYIIGILLAAVLAKLLRISILKGKNTPFVMELPPYRLPTLMSVMIHMWNRAWLYIKKAGTIILSISIVMWFLSYYPHKKNFSVDQRIEAGEHISQIEANNIRNEEMLEYSVAGRIGKFIEPAVKLMGFDWKIATAFIGAFAAKEVFVAQMGIVYSLGAGGEDENLQEKLQKKYSTLTGFCIMLFALLATPCIATVAITKQETGSWKWAVLQFGGLTTIAFIVTTIVYQVGSIIIK